MSIVYEKQLSYPLSVPLFLSLIYSCSVIGVVYLIRLYLRQRSSIFIAARAPILMSLTVSVSWITTLFQMLPVLTNANFYCRSENRPLIWINQTILTGGFTLPTWRCILLILHNRQQKQMIESIAPLISHNQLQNVRSGTLTFIKILLAIISIVPMLSEMAGLKVEPRTDQDAEYRLEYCQVFDPVTVGITIILCFVWMILSLFIKNIDESLNITKELKHCSYVLIIHYLIYTPVTIIVKELHGSFISMIYLMIIGWILTYIVIIRPLYDIKNLGFKRNVSYNSVVPVGKTSSVPSKITTIDNKEQSLDDILNNTALCKALAKHLANEFSAENLAFIHEVDEYKKKVFDVTNGNDLYNDALTIYKQFISKNALTEINLSGYSSDPLHKFFEFKLEKYSDDMNKLRHIFDIARNEIYRLIETDSLIRFYKSKLYLDIVGRTI